MTNLSFDTNKRLALLDLLPGVKSMRPDAVTPEQFDSHLNRAGSCTTPPGPIGRSSAAEYRAAESTTAEAATAANEVKEQPQAVDSEAADSQTAETGDESQVEVTTDTEDTDEEVAEEDSSSDSEEEETDATLISEVASEVSTPAAAIEVDTPVAEQSEAEVESASQNVQPMDDPVPAEPSSRAKSPKESQFPSESGEQTTVESDVLPATATASDGDSNSEAYAQIMPDEEITDSAGDASEDLPSDVDSPVTNAPTAEKPVSAEVVMEPEVIASQVADDEQDTISEPAPLDGEQPDQVLETPDTEATDRPDRSAESPTKTQSKEAAPQATPNQTPEVVEATLEITSVEDVASDTTADHRSNASDKRPTVQSNSSSPNQPASATTSAENAAANRPVSLPGNAPVLRPSMLHSTQAPSDSNITTAADRVRFVQRVYRALHVAHERGGEIRLRLSPPELGNLTLQLKLHDRMMTAHIEAETPTARSLLLENLSVLKERLAAQDIQVERFEVDLMNRHPQRSPDGQSPDHEDAHSLRRFGNRQKTKTTVAAPDGTSAIAQPNSGGGQLNVII